jgi:hypothetical protein
MAVIGGSETAASIALHRSLGFELKGVMTGVGFKLGRWMDIVMMQKALNGGVETLPEGPGLPLGGGARVHLSALLAKASVGRPIAVDSHCYGCTAGNGSSCGGALSAA